MLLHLRGMTGRKVRLDLDGLAVTVLDTAGLRTAEDQIEQIGISRAIERADAADLRVHLLLPDEGPWLEVRPDDLVVSAKADLCGPGNRLLAVSGLTGEGIDLVVGAISAVLQQRVAGIGLAVRERHRVAMVRAAVQLDTALALAAAMPIGVELVAQELRLAVWALDGLVGRIDVEDVLGEVFSRFCIGK